VGRRPIKNTEVVDGKEKIGLEEKLTERFNAIIEKAKRKREEEAAEVSIQLFMSVFNCRTVYIHISCIYPLFAHSS